MKKINFIRIKREPDINADLSYLGTFDEEAKSPFAIEHEPHNPRVLHWFNPQEGTCETKKHARQAYNRILAYERGEWEMISVRAVAEIQTSDVADARYSIVNTIASAGLYGLESDADPADFKEVEREQLAELASILLVLGFTQEEIDSHIANL